MCFYAKYFIIKLLDSIQVTGIIILIIIRRTATRLVVNYLKKEKMWDKLSLEAAIIYAK